MVVAFQPSDQALRPLPCWGSRVKGGRCSRGVKHSLLASLLARNSNPNSETRTLKILTLNPLNPSPLKPTWCLRSQVMALEVVVPEPNLGAVLADLTVAR